MMMICHAGSDDKIGIMTTPGFQGYDIRLS